MNEDKLKKITEYLKDQLKIMLGNTLKEVILFGSYARGDNTTDSDVDFLIIIDGTNIKEKEELILDVAVDLSIQYGVVISAFVKSLNSYLTEKSYKPFLKNIEKEGIRIYAA
ncbi:MAG: nucleotidyltransferase domain-containing protein [Spirochaetales bacterium]|nr:nucleotidyltransferase domain-containing protein [Spirochaetales bacterium]